MAYNRVNWENEPSTATPITADNLNRMDLGIYDASDKIEKMTSEILYKDNSNVAPHILSLTHSAADYSYIEVFARTNDGYFVSGKIQAPQYSTLVLTCAHYTYNQAVQQRQFYVKSLSMQFSNNKATILEDSEVGFYQKDTDEKGILGVAKDTTADDNKYYLKPVKIIGYKTIDKE